MAKTATNKAGKATLANLPPKIRNWVKMKAAAKEIAYDYLTPKQIRMIMQDLPRKLREKDRKEPGWGTGMGVHLQIPKA